MYDVGSKVMTFFEETLPELGLRSNKKYVFRESQFDMALEILDGIKNSKHIVIEAEVGTGKTFAYLVPICYLKKEIPNLSVIFSTGTISLQEQLINDIRHVMNYTGLTETNVVLAKGKTHFLCMKRLTTLANRQPVTNGLENWKMYSTHGDYSELKKVIGEIKEWEKIHVDDSCSWQQCRYFAECGYVQLRNKMKKEANLIVTNHDQLIADALLRARRSRPLFPQNVDIVVIDEAHKLEEKARNALMQSYNLKRINNLLQQALILLRRYSDFDSVHRKIFELKNALRDGFDFVYQNCIAHKYEMEIEGMYPKRYSVDNRGFQIDIIIDTLQNLRDLIEIYVEDDESVSEGLSELIHFLYSMQDLKESNYIYWCEINEEKQEDVTINSIPKNMSDQISELLFQDSNRLYIITSATITNPGQTIEEQYRYLTETIGLNCSQVFYGEPKKSPFDYKSNTILYICDSLPHPNERDEFRKKGAEEIASLIRITKGRSLVLFTSKEDMNAVYSMLIKMNIPWTILIQADGSHQEEVKRQFKDDENSILLSTGIFWEGIDISGPSLSQVIIFRLPFPVPDPIIEYKTSQVDNKMKILLPEMIIQLKQGLGRLIRSESDKGIASILDSRLVNANYKDEVLRGLPFPNVTYDKKDVERFAQEILGF